MKHLDNLDRIEDIVLKKLNDICRFENNEVYVLLAIARPKYNDKISHSANDYKKGPAVFRQAMRKDNMRSKVRRMLSMMYGFRMDEIKPEDFNLYVTFNPRSPTKAYKVLQEKFAHWIIHDQLEKLNGVDSQWISALQRPESRGSKKFYMLDVDNNDHFEYALRNIERVHGGVGEKITFESRNGTHVLVSPFDTKHYKELTEDQNLDVEVKTDSLVNLWCGSWRFDDE